MESTQLNSLMRRKRRGFALVLMVINVGAVLILVRSVRASIPPQLMERATRIMDMQGADDIGYGWLSDHERLATRTPANGASALVCLDLARKQVTPLTAVNPVFQPLNRFRVNGVLTYYTLLAPDGKWLLLDNYSQGSIPPGNPFYHKAVAISLDGKLKRSFALKEQEPTLLWLSDSKHWIECVTDRITIHSLDAPNRTRTVPIVHRQDVAPVYLFDADNARRMGPTDQLVAYHWYHNDPDPTLALYTADLRANPVTPRAVIIRVPLGVTVEAAIVSPDGKRVAWKWFFWNLRTEPAWLQRLLPSLFRSHPTTEIWVSQLDGSDMHEVGQINDTYPNHQPKDLDWIPDSKRLVFSLNDALYSVPAD